MADTGGLERFRLFFWMAYSRHQLTKQVRHESLSSVACKGACNLPWLLWGWVKTNYTQQGLQHWVSEYPNSLTSLDIGGCEQLWYRLLTQSSFTGFKHSNLGTPIVSRLYRPAFRQRFVGFQIPFVIGSEEKMDLSWDLSWDVLGCCVSPVIQMWELPS